MFIFYIWFKNHYIKGQKEMRKSFIIKEMVASIWITVIYIIHRANDITPDNLYLLLTLQECKKDVVLLIFFHEKKKSFFFWISYTSSMGKGLIIFLMDAYATVVNCVAYTWRDTNLVIWYLKGDLQIPLESN